MGSEIADEQAAVKDEQKAHANTRRQLTGYRRRLGCTPQQDSISEARQLAGYQLIDEANRDA
jgi:hypothetical protein